MVGKLYLDNAKGHLDNNRLRRMMADLEKKSAGLKTTLAKLDVVNLTPEAEESYRCFFALAKEHAQIPETEPGHSALPPAFAGKRPLRD